MTRLFHVSEDGPFESLQPRPSPPGSPLEGEPLVWAVDGEHLANYLLPRDCPRVCWRSRAAGDADAGRDRPFIAIEQDWLPRLRQAGLQLHELETRNFELLDVTAGYWISRTTATVRAVTRVDDCVEAIAQRNVRLRLTTSLWPYVDTVTARGEEFSIIRMRNARPRAAPL